MPHRTLSRSTRIVALTAALALAACPPAWAAPPQEDGAEPRSNFEMAQEWLLKRFRRERPPGKYERRHNSVVSVFREVVAAPARSTVEILCDHSPTALGAVVAPGGYILTKASDLEGEVVCKLSDERRLPAELAGVDKEHDLALLKIDAAGLTPVVWSDENEMAVGSWLATPGLEDDPVSIGVVSAAARRIPAPRPILGVLLAEADEGARVDEVMSDSGADEAGLEPGDVIVKLNDEEIKKRDELIRKIRKLLPGDRVRLRVRRGDEELKIEATLGPLPDRADTSSRQDFQNHLGGELSRRRAGFPSVFQHDSILRPHQCGGPVVDLQGQTVGINIARAGRVASYALPAAVVKKALEEMLPSRPVSLDAAASMN